MSRPSLPDVALHLIVVAVACFAYWWAFVEADAHQPFDAILTAALAALVLHLSKSMKGFMGNWS